MTILVDAITAIIYVGSGTIYTLAPEFSDAQNVTGIHDKQHLFQHPFLVMTFEFLSQSLCLILWYIVTGGVTPPKLNNYGIDWDEEEEQEEGAQNEENPGVNDDDEQLIQPNGGAHIQHADADQNGVGRVLDDDDELLDDEDEDDDDEEYEEEPIRYNNPNWNQKPVDQTKFNVLLFVVPAMFDLSRYGLMYIAVKLTYNSSFMLIRSASVLFTVLLRVAFLSKHMAKYMWVSTVMVIVGLGLIGMTDFIKRTEEEMGYDQYGIAAGCLLMMMSQIMISMQIVFEEKFMDKHSIHPLRVVGLEGCYGSLVAIVLLLPFSYVSAGPFSSLQDGRLVDIEDAFIQLKANWIVAVCVVARIVTKPIFYFTGVLFVKNQHDAAKRITIDVHHSLIIWFLSLGLHWQKFFFPQIFGFILVPIGMGIYCDIIPLPRLFRPPAVPPPAGPLPEQLMLENQEGGVGGGEGGDGADPAQMEVQVEDGGERVGEMHNPVEVA